MFDINYFILSILISLFAFVYSNILTGNGELLGGIYSKLYHYFRTNEREQQGLPPHPLFKFIIHCEKCVAGQVSYWSFLILHFNGYREISFTLVLQHILFVTLTIFITVLVKSFYQKHIE